MEAFLIDEWLGAEDAIPLLDEASLTLVRERVRDVAAAQKLSATSAGRLATIASELGRNQLRHGRRGQIAACPVVRDGHPGVEIIAADAGGGLLDPTRALEGTPRAQGSLGVGLASARELASELDIDVRVHEGTCLRARVFDGAPPRRREVGIFGRPHRDESRSGDHACMKRDDRRLLVGVCDGLGHGAPAREAAGAAMRVFHAQHAAAPKAILEECHRALGGTRGAVMAVVALRERDASDLELASVGNITVQLVRPHASRSFGATSFVVGAAQRGWRAHGETVAVDPDEVLVLYTDGIVSRASLADERALLRQHPIVIAQHLLERFGREDDDALVVVAR